MLNLPIRKLLAKVSVQTVNFELITLFVNGPFIAEAAAVTKSNQKC